MHPELIESMRDQACIIYRAVTGSDISAAQPPTSESEAPLEEVTRSFAELEAMTRAIPSLAGRVPPFSFTPPLDVILEEEEVLVEMVVPGTERADITVLCENDTLVISGIRRERHAGERTYSHCEIPRGPFYRSLHVPFSVAGEPAVTLERGLLRVRLKRHLDEQRGKAAASSGLQQQTDRPIQTEERKNGTDDPRSSTAESSDSGSNAGRS